MVFGFNNLLGSPQGANKRPSGLEFTPIGKRNGDESSFQVIQSYPQDYSPLSTNRRTLFQPLKESNNIAHYSQESGLFDETIEDFEKVYSARHPLTKKQTKSPLPRRDLIAEEDAGIAAKQLEETIKELRLENYGWKIKYKELRRSLENMPQLESDVRKVNIELNEQIGLLKQEIQKLKVEKQEINKENIEGIIQEKDLVIEQLNDELHDLKRKLSSQRVVHESQSEYEEMIQQLQSEREELHEKIQDLEGYMTHAENEFDEAMKEKNELKEEIARLQRGRENQDANLEDRLSQKNKELKQLEEDVLKKDQLVELLQSEMKNLESKSTGEEAKLGMEVEVLREKLQEQENIIESLERNQKSKKELYVSEIHALDYKCKELEAELDEAYTKLKNTDTKNGELRNRCEEQSKKLEILSNDMADRINQIDIYEKEFEKVHGELKAADENLESTKEKLESSTKANELLSREMELLKKSVQDYEELKIEYHAYQEGKSHEITQLKHQLIHQEQKIAKLEDAVERFQARAIDKSELHADNVHLSNKLETSWKQIDDLQRKLEDLKFTKEKEVDYEINSNIRNLKEQILDLKEENSKLKLETQKAGYTREEVVADNVELADQLRDAESARMNAEKKVVKLESEISELLVTIDELDSRLKYSLEDTYVAELKKEIVKLRSDIKVSDDYIGELEAKARRSQVIEVELENLQKELDSSTSLLKSHESKIKYLESELEKGKSSEPSVIQDYVEFQLSMCRKDLDKATEQLKVTEEKYHSKLQKLQEEKQVAEIDLMKFKSKNTELNMSLESSKEDLLQMTRNCKRLAKKVSDNMQVRKKLDSPEWIQFLENESIYFKRKFMEEFTRKCDYKFLYNYAVRSIKNSSELLSLNEKNANLVRLGLYPEYVNLKIEKRPKLTFAGLAKFVLASVRIRNRTQDHLSTLKDLRRVRGEIDVARINFS